MNDSIPDLKIEHMEDGIGDGLILLEQDNCGNIDRVAIHPLHLRFMAEQMGLVATSDPAVLKTIETLTRRLYRLCERAEHMAQWMAEQAACGRDGMAYGQVYAQATADIATEYCDGLQAPAADLGNTDGRPAQTGDAATSVQQPLTSAQTLLTLE
jgi:hypothetical protein